MSSTSEEASARNRDGAGNSHGDRAQRTSERTARRARDAGESRKTVLIALFANGVIALAKLFGGLASGSSAMLAEAAHSVADTTNQAFLLFSIRLSTRKPSPDRPFGHGQERFLWTFVAAVGMFVAGAIFAIGYGVYEIAIGGEKEKDVWIAYVVLAIAFAAEGTSWVRAYRQTRNEAKEHGVSIREHVRRSRDPNVKMVLSEDTAALIGIGIATIGITLNLVTGSKLFDPAASVAVGLLLWGVAFWMARDAKHLLVGWAARPDERDAIERAIEEYDEVEEVVELLTMVLAPNSLLVAARVNLRDDIEAAQVEEVSGKIDKHLREVVPDVSEVFLDATSEAREPVG